MTLSPGNGNIIITDTGQNLLILNGKNGTLCRPMLQAKQKLTDGGNRKELRRLGEKPVGRKTFGRTGFSPNRLHPNRNGFMVKTATVETATNSIMMKFIRHTERTQYPLQ